jgi:hypothetical protein
MSLKVMYVPFANDADLIAGADRIVKAHNSAHRVDTFRDGVVVPGDKALDNVMRFQQLYIVAHGTAGANFVESNDGTKLSVTDLAKQLAAQKLTKAIYKVKLYCCNGGVGGVNSTAKLLKDALRAEAFTNVSVYGYTQQLDQGRLVDGHKEAYSGVDFHDDGSWTMQGQTGAKSVRVKH